MSGAEAPDAAKRVDFPLRRTGGTFPPQEYEEFREREGLVWSTMPTGDRVWLVTRYEDVRAVLTHPKISSDPRHEGFPAPGRTGGPPAQTQVPGWFAALDPPEHDRYRKVLIPEFSFRRIKELRPRIQEIVEGCVERLLAKGSPADLVTDFAVPVPSLVICELLGVPPVDRGFFESRIRVLVTLTSTDEERDEATKQLLRYLGRMHTIKRRRPGDDLISVLIRSEALTPMETAGAALLLLIAGQETTANNIALGAVTLLSNPQWIGDDGVVEELLRFYSVADLVPLRVAVADVEIAGQVIKAGEGIAPLVAAANFDGSAFSCPHQFDPGRSEQHHIAFGFGRHLCLGAHLVRAEMELAYQTLFQRIPTLELARPVEELVFKEAGVLHGLDTLPVRW
ncbi:cytochrome P450 [Streptomyces coffeae]|uniref:cytochrome P450 n=1 Tax=Streptomyces coffeae TaxID=621382 RepID=UPI003FD8620A